MAVNPTTQAYLYAALLPGGGPPAWGPGLDGRRCADFARATGCQLVRWPVQVATFEDGGEVRGIVWRHHE